MKTLLTKSNEYKSKHDMYVALMRFIEVQKQNSNPDEGMNVMTDSTEVFYVDRAFQTITIFGAQKALLDQANSGGAAVRALVDFLFEPEVYQGS